MSTVDGRHPRKGRAAAAGVAGAGLLLLALPPAIAVAEPPTALPASAAEADAKWQPALDYDGDGCYPTPAIGSDGTIAPGLDTTGAVSGNCHDQSDLDNTNAYSRAECNSGWCAYVYDLYFEKDQAVDGSGLGGHRHDLEHVIVWVENDEAKYVSTSAHGDYSTHPAEVVQWEGTHAKVVYHKDGVSTHCFRLAGAGEEPENHYGTWQYPALVSWDDWPDTGLRDTLTSADFGSASMAIKDDAFASNLEKAKPEGIPFDPHG